MIFVRVSKMSYVGIYIKRKRKGIVSEAKSINNSGEFCNAGRAIVYQQSGKAKQNKRTL